LKLPVSATEADIKKAYRNLVVTVHPDKGGDADEFLKIQKAYDILKNPDERNAYDYLRNNTNRRQGPGGGSSSANPSSSSTIFGRGVFQGHAAGVYPPGHPYHNPDAFGNLGANPNTGKVGVPRNFNPYYTGSYPVGGSGSNPNIIILLAIRVEIDI
jgi:DnaJ-class molecular chaperone